MRNSDLIEALNAQLDSESNSSAAQMMSTASATKAMVIRRLASSIGLKDMLRFRLHFITANNAQMSINQIGKPRVFLLRKEKISELVRNIAMVGFNQE